MKDSDGTVTSSKNRKSNINDSGVSDFNARKSLNVSGERQHLLSSRNQTPDLVILTSDQAGMGGYCLFKLLGFNGASKKITLIVESSRFFQFN